MTFQLAHPIMGERPSHAFLVAQPDSILVHIYFLEKLDHENVGGPRMGYEARRRHATKSSALKVTSHEWRLVIQGNLSKALKEWSIVNTKTASLRTWINTNALAFYRRLHKG